MPTAEIITIGTELLLGEIQDTNTRYLARALRDLGVDLYRTTTIGDNEERIAAGDPRGAHSLPDHHHHRRPGPHRGRPHPPGSRPRPGGRTGISPRFVGADQDRIRSSATGASLPPTTCARPGSPPAPSRSKIRSALRPLSSAKLARLHRQPAGRAARDGIPLPECHRALPEAALQPDRADQSPRPARLRGRRVCRSTNGSATWNNFQPHRWACWLIPGSATSASPPKPLRSKRPTA